MKILLIEDDTDTSRFVANGLRERGHVVDQSEDGRDGLFLASEAAYDVMVIDRMLPRVDGLAIVKTVRAAGVKAPVLMLTTLSGVNDRVEGLEAGADDYLVKPFAIAELTARLQALLRRRGNAGTGPLVVGDVVVDARRHVATRSGRDLGLTRREFDLLEVFARHPGQVLSRDQLLRLVWGYASDVETNVVDVFVGYLRRKLEAGGEPRALHTVRGVGWALRP